MTNVFVSQASMRYELTQVLGVFDSLEEAKQRCRDRPAADEGGTMPYDNHWVEEWTLNGDFLRQHNLFGFEETVEAYNG
jgi:hypothetical protein